MLTSKISSSVVLHFIQIPVRCLTESAIVVSAWAVFLLLCRAFLLFSSKGKKGRLGSRGRSGAAGDDVSHQLCVLRASSLFYVSQKFKHFEKNLRRLISDCFGPSRVSINFKMHKFYIQR